MEEKQKQECSRQRKRQELWNEDETGGGLSPTVSRAPSCSDFQHLWRPAGHQALKLVSGEGYRAQTPAQTLACKFPILLPRSRGRASEHFQHGESEWGERGSILGSFSRAWTVWGCEDPGAVSRGEEPERKEAGKRVVLEEQ